MFFDVTDVSTGHCALTLGKLKFHQVEMNPHTPAGVVFAIALLVVFFRKQCRKLIFRFFMSAARMR
jgi:hypothetical protein